MKKAVIAIMVLSTVPASFAAGKSDYTGFWKKNCEDPFGIQIKPVSNGLYAISFCKGDGCTGPGAYRPNSKIENDPMYEALSQTRLKVRDAEGTFSTYTKCSSETLPPLKQKN